MKYDDPYLSFKNHHEIYDIAYDGQEFDEDEIEEDDYYDDELENEDGGTTATSESLASNVFTVFTSNFIGCKNENTKTTGRYEDKRFCFSEQF